jgi:tetratricopeptide (TPR) repeat protein
MRRTPCKTILLACAISLLSAAAWGYEKYADALAGAKAKMNQKQFPEALTDSDAALALATNAVERFNAGQLRAQILGNAGKPDEALAAYRQLAEGPDATPRQKVVVYRAMADLILKNSVLAKGGDVGVAARAVLDEALRLPDLVPADAFAMRMDRAKTYEAGGNGEAAIRELEVLKTADQTAAQKAEILQGILGLRIRYSDVAACRPVVDELLRTVQGTTIRVDWHLNAFAGKAAEAGDYPAARDAYQSAFEQAPDIPGPGFGAAEMALVLGDAGAASSVLAKLVGNPKIPAAQRYIARIVQLCADSSEGFRGRIALADKEFAGESFSREQRFKGLREAAMHLFTAGRYDAVRALEAEAGAMMRPEAVKTFTCRYAKDVPRSADAWSRSPILKEEQYREARFDVMANLDDSLACDLMKLAGSTNAPPAPKKEGYDTAAYIVYDERGVHIYAACKDPEARKVDQGLESGGSLEMYVQPGIDHAYHWWWFDLPGTDDPHQVNWDTPHRHYRYTYDYVAKNASVVDGGIGAYTFIPWLLVYDKLPSDSNRWRLGLQRYSKGGALTLGGTVHEIGRSLELAFDMPKERLLAVKRDIVTRAFAKYQADRKRADGVSLWSDPVLGDPAFYTNAVLPVLEALDKAGETVGGAMTDSDVESLFETRVPDWMELSFKVAELRRDYLKAKLF